MIIRLLVIAALIGSTQSVYAQVTNSCSSVAADPDGDGFGWENNASCQVTAQSATTPKFVNQETGMLVSLTRAYWDQTDFHVRKDVICKEKNFDGSSYIEFRDGLLMDFQPLPESAPFQGTVTVYGGLQRAFSFSSIPWTLENGIYSGPTALAYSPWLEIISIAGSARVKRATRTWTSNYSYTECNSINPLTEFVPTGSPPVTENPFVGDCVDTDPVGDGWGWDGVTSCRVSGVNTPTTNTCTDTDPVGDGWGWDGVSSCRVTD